MDEAGKEADTVDEALNEEPIHVNTSSLHLWRDAIVPWRCSEAVVRNPGWPWHVMHYETDETTCATIIAASEAFSFSIMSFGLRNEANKVRQV